MVSSTCRGSCPTMATVHTTRKLHIDPNKDYKTPLQVETSVEYDLPSHIYPPKGSQPILMIHPAYATSRARKIAVSSPSPSASSPTSGRPLAALQFNSQVRSGSKISQGRSVCSCGNSTCNNSVSYPLRILSVRSVQQQITQPPVLSSRQVPQVQEIGVVVNSSKSSQPVDQKTQQQKHMQQKAQLQKQLQAQQQKQLKLLQQNQLHQAKMQTQHMQQLQAKQQKEQSQPNSRIHSVDQQLLTWGSIARCQGPCCQPRIGALPPPQAEFLAPGLPPSLLARTPTRGPAGGSPKLRARTRRGLSVASTINLPEYLGSTRPSRASSVGGGVGTNHTHHRTRSSANSSLVSTPGAPITAHQVASALDVVRAHALTPRSLFPSQNSSSLTSAISNTNSLLSSTVGQCRDSGCSISAADMSIGNSGSENVYSSSNSYSNGNMSNSSTGSKNMEWNRNVVDSGFCTPVDIEDQLMEPLDLNISSNLNSSYIQSALPTATLLKDTASHTNWMREITSMTPATPLGGLQNPFLQAKTAAAHYIPQPICNLAY